MATRISSDDFETQVLLSETPVLTEFYSDSCIPCKRMSPLLSQIESQYGDSLKVVKVNINFDADLAKEYGVSNGKQNLVCLFSCCDIILKRGFYAVSFSFRRNIKDR